MNETEEYTVYYLCNKEKVCCGPPSCGYDCNYTLDGSFVKNPESIKIAEDFFKHFELNIGYFNDKCRFYYKEKEETE